VILWFSESSVAFGWGEMNYFTWVVLFLLFVFVGETTSVRAAERAPTAIPPINITTQFSMRMGERRTAQIGDVIHEDRRILSTQVLTVRNAVKDECNIGWCHNFAAGAELVYVGYGPRIYCSGEKTGQRNTLFSDYPSFSCVVRDQQSGVPDKIFGLKQFTESLRIDAKDLPRSIQVSVSDHVLTAYPEWALQRKLTFIDGVFRIRFAGLENGAMMLDLEHEPEIVGSQPALTRRISVPLGYEGFIPMPFMESVTEYEAMVERGVRFNAVDYSGVRLKVFDTTPTSVDYETGFDTELFQIFPDGHWRILSGGRAVVSRDTYR
jgi:hypothetical protein